MAMFFPRKKKMETGEMAEDLGELVTLPEDPSLVSRPTLWLTVTHSRQPNTFSCVHKHVDKPLRQR